MGNDNQKPTAGPEGVAQVMSMAYTEYMDEFCEACADAMVNGPTFDNTNFNHPCLRSSLTRKECRAKENQTSDAAQTSQDA